MILEAEKMTPAFDEYEQPSRYAAWAAGVRDANARIAPLVEALERMDASDGNGRDCERVLAEFRKLKGETDG